MGCNCKNKRINAEKYADNVESSENKVKLSLFSSLLKILLQFCFGILCGIVIIVMVVPVLLYIIGCLVTGKSASFKIKDFKRKPNKAI